MPKLKAEITVAAVIAVDERFLIVEEKIRGRLVLNQPAGHVEDRETLITAVVRETREETAWLFNPQSLVGIYHWRNPDTGITTMRFAFRGDVSDHRPQQALDNPVIAAHWLTLEELRLRKHSLRNPLVLRCIDDFQRGSSLPLHSVADLDLETARRLRAVQL